MKNIRKDIFGFEPKIGDIIVFNPAQYKGLIYGKCVGFTKSGLPELKVDNAGYFGQTNSKGNYAPKTTFVIYNEKIKQ